jgi:hypothetical protein
LPEGGVSAGEFAGQNQAEAARSAADQYNVVSETA